jgi:hypothetical protein
VAGKRLAQLTEQAVDTDFVGCVGIVRWH